MSPGEREWAGETKAAVRVRVPERRQVAMVVQCPDDLVAAQHPVRIGLVLVEMQGLSLLVGSRLAREGVAGRAPPDPGLLVALWLYGCIRVLRSKWEFAR